MKPFLAAIVLAGALGCSGLPARVTEGPPTGAPLRVLAIEREVFDRINDYRRSVNDPPLALDARLSELAREHSEAMAVGARPFGHDGFEERSAAARAALGVSTMSENVATNNYPTSTVAEQVVEGWIGSPGHLRNLRGAYALTGVGVARTPAGEYFVTQIYAAR